MVLEVISKNSNCQWWVANCPLYSLPAYVGKNGIHVFLLFCPEASARSCGIYCHY